MSKLTPEQIDSAIYGALRRLIEEAGGSYEHRGRVYEVDPADGSIFYHYNTLKLARVEEPGLCPKKAAFADVLAKASSIFAPEIRYLLVYTDSSTLLMDGYFADEYGDARRAAESKASTDFYNCVSIINRNSHQVVDRYDGQKEAA